MQKVTSNTDCNCSSIYKCRVPEQSSAQGMSNHADDPRAQHVTTVCAFDCKNPWLTKVDDAQPACDVITSKYNVANKVHSNLWPKPTTFVQFVQRIGPPIHPAVTGARVNVLAPSKTARRLSEEGTLASSVSSQPLHLSNTLSTHLISRQALHSVYTI